MTEWKTTGTSFIELRQWDGGRTIAINIAEIVSIERSNNGQGAWVSLRGTRGTIHVQESYEDIKKGIQS